MTPRQLEAAVTRAAAGRPALSIIDLSIGLQCRSNMVYCRIRDLPDEFKPRTFRVAGAECLTPDSALDWLLKLRESGHLFAVFKELSK